MKKREAEKKIDVFKASILPILFSFFLENIKKRNFYNCSNHSITHSFIGGTKNSEFELKYHFAVKYKNSETIVNWYIPLDFKNFDDISKFKKLSKAQKDIFIKELDEIESSELEMTKKHCSHIMYKLYEKTEKDISKKLDINGIRYKFNWSRNEITVAKDYYPNCREHNFNNYTIVSIGDNVFNSAIEELVERGNIEDTVEEIKRIIEFVAKNINTEIDSNIDLNRSLSLFLEMNLKLV